MAKTYRTIEAVRKTIDILEFLSRQKEPVAGPDVARGVDLPIGTVMCHLTTLEAKNYVHLIGDRIELGSGAALIWARKKAILEGRLDQINRELRILEEGV